MDLPSSPAALRNRGPILEALRPWLPQRGRVLETAAGSGEHAVFLSRALPGLAWSPTDADADAVGWIEARRAAEGAPNLRAPVRLDVVDADTWPVGPFDAVLAINLIHISPWAVCEALVAGAARTLAAEGVLLLYGPFVEAEVETAPSNLAFDASLKARDPRWGLRSLAAVEALAAASGLTRVARTAMPANNLAVAFRRA